MTSAGNETPACRRGGGAPRAFGPKAKKWSTALLALAKGLPSEVGHEFGTHLVLGDLRQLIDCDWHLRLQNAAKRGAHLLLGQFFAARRTDGEAAHTGLGRTAFRVAVMSARFDPVNRPPN